MFLVQELILYRYS